MTRKIFQEEIKRFSRHLSRTKPGTKNLLLLDNFSGHLIDLVALGVHNVQVEYFKPGCTGQFQPLDMLFFAALKNQYRIFLRKFRQGQQKSSPGLELSVKTVARLGSEMKPGIVRACWRKTGLTRFAKLQGDTIDNEEEEIRRHSIERIEEELAQLQLQDDDEEDVEVMEIAEQQREKQITRHDPLEINEQNRVWKSRKKGLLASAETPEFRMEIRSRKDVTVEYLNTDAEGIVLYRFEDQTASRIERDCSKSSDNTTLNHNDDNENQAIDQAIIID
ncbi:Oidioi.mRNA.OKI2018_I69.YSR.g17060.t1.cds [Oikopleura dioica]|uniref:Oidioi.mRNA.OKI2018_I69.YSR.g17060.t1.cds n=1 Tax=Oikopleura dioica TaxID=34765 RepID=A0ABN7SLV2_OIKDI|nr:Oidioi.mRNA.OKI2018_I69.YSR.g17060.t1.cds [Oikopleura dioica]